ncbi:helix-turn-helix domain-containing protein [Streptomyces winkii]|uniref:helix-turn-helix domain-containing protein n=1 Tax=Streptomyces winkii TaxID=3051178 RepID=UPI0028D04A19|nr:helix-turn-helix transcriptional regulator [Streptomyces sp. DSM 40971]
MYRERQSRVGGAVVWAHTGEPGGEGRVLPDGCMDLLMWDGRLVVAGPDTRAYLFARQPGSRITGLRLPPGVGPLVFGAPAHEFRDRRVPLAEVWSGRSVRLLQERVAEAPDAGRALEAVAAGRLAEQGSSPVRPVAGPVRPVARLLARGRGVAEVAREVGLSERQLHRRCLDAFGYGPKTLARVLRMQEALLLAGGGVPPAEVAHLAGYADQAHLSRDVRALAGVPLGRLLGQDSGAKRSTPLPSGSATTA